MTEEQRAVAGTVSAVAADRGGTPAQVAIGWTGSRSPSVCPVIGARTLSQLADNLGFLAVELPPDALQRVEAAAEFDVGFPATFIDQSAG